jgi:carbamoylphosphate synthase large subunit
VDLSREIPDVKLIGQNPFNTERFDDKQWTNAYLAKQHGLAKAFPKARLFSKGDRIADLEQMGLPLIAKPIRGRGSHGVTLVTTLEELDKAVEGLLEESDRVLVEEYLAGEEITITVMPPGEYDVGTMSLVNEMMRKADCQNLGSKPSHWSLPVVTRFNHSNGTPQRSAPRRSWADRRSLQESRHTTA